MKQICKFDARCGACCNLDKDMAWQLADKTNYIKDLFKDIDCEVSDCHGEFYAFKYRNKVHLAFGELKGKTIIGFYEDNSTKITDIDGCMLVGDWLKSLIKILREFVSRFKIRPYNRIGQGIIRYAHARCIDNKLQLTLVVTTDNFAGRDWLYNKLLGEFAEVSLYININKRTDHAVFDKYFKFCKGSRYLKFKFAGVDVSLTPNSFLQVNVPVAEKMYKMANFMLDIKDDTTVFDLYSGIGITSVIFSEVARDVVSIEEVSEAVENAKFISKLNGRKNIRCFCGKCEDVIHKFTSEKDTVVFVDPARAGLDRSVVDAINKLLPRKIVYMSCNPETCVRDIKYLLKSNNYIVSDIKPYNMFPYTKHIEMLVCMQRQ